MKPAPDAITALAHALAYRQRMGFSAPGAGQVALRVTISHEEPSDMATARAELDRIMGVGIPDMPPPTDDVSLLLDALAFRIGAHSRADAWRSIGINPNRGRDLLARNAQAVDWPIWRCMVLYALEDGLEA